MKATDPPNSCQVNNQAYSAYLKKIQAPNGGEILTPAQVESGPIPRREPRVFIPKDLDDYGLTPPEFRVYCHVARRDGFKGAFSANANMARVCMLHPQTVRKALKSLVAYGLLSCERRLGRTTIYRLKPQSSWHARQSQPDPATVI